MQGAKCPLETAIEEGTHMFQIRLSRWHTQFKFWRQYFDSHIAQG